MQTGSSSAAVDEAMRCEMRGLLGVDGDAVALRTLCTVVAGGVVPPVEVARVALEAVRAALMTRDRRFPQPLVAQYLADRIVSLLALGVFRIAGDDLRGITTVVEYLLAGKEDAARELVTRAARGWGSGRARDGLVRRVRELVLDRAARAGLKPDNYGAVDTITRSYFLIDVPEIREQVIGDVVARLGGESWTR